MDVDRETVLQLILAGGSVGLFIVGAFVVGTTYTTNGTLSPEGGMVLVATIGILIVLFLVVGLWLERQEFQ